MESPSRILVLPIDGQTQTIKYPMYYAGRDGSLYIFQNVVGGELRRARHVILVWESERVNLGYFAPELTEPMGDIRIVKAEDLMSLDPDISVSLVNYGRGVYAALLKMSGSVVF